MLFSISLYYQQWKFCSSKIQILFYVYGGLSIPKDKIFHFVYLTFSHEPNIKKKKIES